MKSYFAYIRVSTTRQGEEGVSLQEQRRANLEYASRRGITVGKWFKEQVGAAKQGPPMFTRLVGLLRSRRAAGLIIHKIYRGARNLWDSADMGELMDRGIEVHQDGEVMLQLRTTRTNNVWNQYWTELAKN